MNTNTIKHRTIALPRKTSSAPSKNLFKIKILVNNSKLVFPTSAFVISEIITFIVHQSLIIGKDQTYSIQKFLSTIRFIEKLKNYSTIIIENDILSRHAAPATMFDKLIVVWISLNTRSVFMYRSLSVVNGTTRHTRLPELCSRWMCIRIWTAE